ncbi:MAG: CPBP family intramembrane metalloprotease [Calditrichaeota bacterium]|nr:CPBP family intramembrane metalloprotease [Calditrichota bacterium]MCB9391375.1 CPBP family intramembrane metalloprotease [Calditrichota bacterium]
MSSTAQQWTHDRGTSFLSRLFAVGWRLVLFVGVFLALYLPFLLPYILYPETEYQTLESLAVRAGVELIAMVTMLLAAIAMTRYADRRQIADLGFVPRHLISGLTAGTIAGGLLCVVVLAVLAAISDLKFARDLAPMNELFWLMTALFLNTVFQEVLVHGYVQQMVKSHFGTAAGVIISSFMMVLIHWTLFKPNALLVLTNLFAFAAMLGIVFEVSKSLWWPIGVHFGWNYLQGPLLGLPVTGVDIWNSDIISLQGNTWLTGGTMGLEGSLLTSLILLLASGILWKRWGERTRAVAVPGQTMR